MVGPSRPHPVPPLSALERECTSSALSGGTGWGGGGEWWDGGGTGWGWVGQNAFWVGSNAFRRWDRWDTNALRFECARPPHLRDTTPHRPHRY